MRLAEDRAHRGGGVERNAERQRSVANRLEALDLPALASFPNREILLAEPGDRPSRAVGDGGQELDELDLDPLQVVGQAEKPDVLGGPAVGKPRLHGQEEHAVGVRDLELRFPGRVLAPRHHRVTEPELDTDELRTLRHDDLRPRAMRSGRHRAAPRLDDAHRQVTGRSVEDDLVGQDQGVLAIVALRPDDHLPGDRR